MICWRYSLAKIRPLRPESVFIEPDWPAPANILALSTTRSGGVSDAPFASFNLAHHVGDKPAAVTANRGILAQRLPTGASVQWLQQVHGTRVLQASRQTCGDYPDAVGSRTRASGVACAVLTADCLPVLLCDRAGSVVAAAHAGWRGLAAGVLEACVRAMAVNPGELMAWLGPAIGPEAFEVGPEVRQAFLEAVDVRQTADCFQESASREGYFLADLYGLARLRLAVAGVPAVFGGEYCTYNDTSCFYSYRRDGQTGRMASLILINS